MLGFNGLFEMEVLDDPIEALLERCRRIVDAVVEQADTPQQIRTRAKTVWNRRTL